MNDTAPTLTKRGRRMVGVLIAAGLLLVAAANWHLVYVAVTSQPDCVAHLRAGSAQSSGQFSAAKSSCTPG
jgi:hypothetical protein